MVCVCVCACVCVHVCVCMCVCVCFSVSLIEKSICCLTCDFADIGLVACDVERFPNANGRHLVSTARHGV